MADLVAKLVLTGDSSGIVGAAESGSASLNKLRDSAAQAGAAGAGMAPAFDAGTAAIAGQTAASTAASAALSASGQAKLDEIARLTQLASASSATTSNITALSAAHGQYNSVVNAARALLASGALTQAQYATAVEGASAKLALSTVMHDESSTALNKELGAAAALGLGLQGLGETASAAGHGAEAVEHFAVAGEHLGKSLLPIPISMRGLKALFEGFAEVATTPVGAFLLVSAAVGIVVAAEQTYEASINRLNVAAIAHNNVLKLSSAGYQDLASHVSDAANVSQAEGRTIVESFLNSGAQSVASINSASAAVQGYAVMTGQSADKAQEAIAKMFADPAEAASQLTSEYGLFSDTQLQMIKNLQDVNDKAAAQGLVFDALKGKVAPLTGEVTAAAREWAFFTKNLSDSWNAANAWYDLLVKFGSAALNSGLPFSAPETLEVTGRAGQAAHNAQRNQESVEAGDIERGAAYYGKGDQVDAIDKKITQLNIDEADGATTAAKANAALIVLEKQRADVIASGAAALNKLNAEDKAHLDNINHLISAAPEQIAMAQDHASALMKEAQASDGTALSIKALQEALDVKDKVQPFETALEQLDALHDKGAINTAKYAAAHAALIDAFNKTAAAAKEDIAAQDELAAKQDVHSQFSGLSLANDNDPAHVQEISAQMRAMDLQDLDAWRANTLSKVASVEVGYAQYAEQVQDIFDVKQAAIYQADLQRRTDWAAGVQRGLNDLTKSTNDWATTSESLLKSFSSEGESEFVKWATGGKDVLQDFFQWFEQQALKLAYEKVLAPITDNLVAQGMQQLGSLFSSGGGSNPLSGLLGSVTGARPTGTMTDPIYVAMSALGLGGGGGLNLGSLLGSNGGVGASIDPQFADAFSGASSSSGIASIFSDLFAFLGFHSGGTVGVDTPMRFMLSQSVFDGAPRYHGGGTIPGLQPGDFPIIAQEGETIRTVQQEQDIQAALSRPVVIQMPARGANDNAMPPIHFSFTHNNGTQASVSDPRRNADGSINIDVVTDMVDQGLAARSAMGRSQFTQSLESTHKLVRQPGV